MNIQEYIEKMREVQFKFLQFIDKEENEEENFENLIQIIEDQNIKTDNHNLKIFLYIVNQISNYHYRGHHFFEKIEKILKAYHNEIQTKFTNLEIFNIFSKNKRILLFLFEQRIVTIDDHILSEMKKIQFNLKYFSPEIKSFIDEMNHQINNNSICYDEYYQNIQNISNENFDAFNAKRKKGENEDLICEIIRNDSINEFISYVNENNYSLSNHIKPSIFETNFFLIGREKTTLIEYSAFFGSIQIFKYLVKNKIKLTESLWMYAVHGNNKEIIQILVSNKIILQKDGIYIYDFFYDVNYELNLNQYGYVSQKNISYEKCVIEAIKSHHNEIAYFVGKFAYQANEVIKLGGFISYNFLIMPNCQIESKFLLYGCAYDYYTIVDLYLYSIPSDLNHPFISILIFYESNRILADIYGISLII